MRARFVVLLVALLSTPVLAGCLDGDSKKTDDSTTAPVSPIPLDVDGFGAILSTGWTYSDESHASDLVEHNIQMEVYLPDPATTVDGMALPEGFPTLLMASPYWGNGVGPDLKFGGYPAYEGLLQRLIQRGYAIVLGDSASMGGSGGCWDFMGPADVAGSLALLDVITKQPWSNGKVAMHGLSYDGMTQIMASSHAPEGLVTLIPAAALTHAYAGLYQSGVHYGGGWHSTTASYTQSSIAPRTAQSRQGGWLESVASSPECADTNVHGNDATGAYNPYFQARDFRPLGANVKASVFYIQGFYDGAVKPDNLGEWFDNVPTDKKLWLGWWPHTYPNATQGGRDDLILTLHKWLDHEMLDVPNGILDEPMVSVQDSEGWWRTEDQWPPADTQHLGLSLSADQTMAETGAQEGAITVGHPSGTAGSLLANQGATRLTWTTPEDVRIVGSPLLSVEVASDRAGGYLVARLWDEDPAGGLQPVSKGATNLRIQAEGASALQPGTFYKVELDMYPTDYVLRSGHTLVLEMLTQDATQWYDPDAEQAVLTIKTGDDVSALNFLSVERPDEGFLYGCGSMLGRYQDCHDDKLRDQGIGQDS